MPNSLYVSPPSGNSGTGPQCAATGQYGPKDTVTDRIGERARSRLVEMYRVVRIETHDYRLAHLGRPMLGGAPVIVLSRDPGPEPMDYSKIITIEPGKMGGKPCIRGMRMTVYDVLDYLASGMSEDEILHDFPDLTRDDIRACLAFAADRERRLAGIPA